MAPPPFKEPLGRGQVNQMMACSCGSPLEDGDAFCGNCGNPRPLITPPPAPPPPSVHDRIPGPPPRTIPQPVVPQPVVPQAVVPQPVVPQTGIQHEQARRGGWSLTGQRREDSALATQSRESISPSPFDADTIYLQKTLRHEPMELALDDSVAPRTIGILLIRAFLAWGIVLAVCSLVGGYEAAHGGGGVLLFVGSIASIVVFWVVLLASKVTEPIGEWRTLLADRGWQSESYYRMVAAVLQRRELPIGLELRSIRLRTPGRPVKHTIVLSENEYQTYVTVFPYGTSLYVGWQMWRRRSGAQLIKRALIDRVTAANLVTAMLRTDRARAVREAVHLACREAVYATPDEGLWAEAQQLRLPQVEEETALLMPQQSASPDLPSPATMMPPSPSAP
jgi:hypothetical protein